MEKSSVISIIVFVAVAVGLLWYGSQYTQYNGKISDKSAEAQQKTGVVAEQNQSKPMDNLQIKDIIVGSGAEAKKGNTVTVNYVGTLDNGNKFDSSYDRNEPFTFNLGAGDVIKGWDLGVAGMKVGGKRELIIPFELGYGKDGRPPVIPPNATLHFTVELLAVR